MKSIASYIYESIQLDKMLKLSEDDLKRLINLDKKYNELVMKRRKGFNEKDVKNIDEEMDNFFAARKKNKKYYPKLDLGKCSYEDDDIVNDLKKLLNEFTGFKSCFLSKYYIINIQRMIEWCEFYIKKFNGDNNTWTNTLSKTTYNKALEILKNNPYQSTKDIDRNINAKEAKKMIQNALDELKFPWKAEIYDNMLARMNVLPEKIIRISSDAKFNDADIEGLIEHEIKGHIGRKWYGMKTGLYIFVHGLRGRCLLDEGLAVWNSINKTKHAKPNVLFNIALKYIISYKKQELDFCELFNFIKELNIGGDIPDEVIFKTIVRAKREIIDMKLIGGLPDDADYLEGYLLIDKMSDKDRDNILKWNVGLDQIYEIPTIKRFFELNKFKPIE